MAFEASILADSISPYGHRLTTFQLTYPRIIHAELLTHRFFARSAASSRAIPISSMISRVLDDPYIPTHWGKNQRGMQAEQELTPEQIEIERQTWIEERDWVVTRALARSDRGLHKQLTNRPLETYQWYTAIYSATELSNFFHLRNNPQAHPEMQCIARLALERLSESTPQKLKYGEWHLPLVSGEDWELMKELGLGDLPQTWVALAKVSCARCARVSYLTHEGKRDLKEDLDLCGRLLRDGHMSPFEHAARPMSDAELKSFRRAAPIAGGPGASFTFDEEKPTYFLGPFNGWVQYRKTIRGEEDILGYRMQAPENDLGHRMAPPE